MEINGTLIKKFDSEQITEKFKKRQLVIRIEGDYPQEILLQLTQAKCDLLDKFNEGQTVTAHFNLEGRKHNDKWYNSLTVWKII